MRKYEVKHLRFAERVPSPVIKNFSALLFSFIVFKNKKEKKVTAEKIFDCTRSVKQRCNTTKMVFFFLFLRLSRQQQQNEKKLCQY